VLSCLGVLELYGGTYTRAAELLEEAAGVATGRQLLRTLSDLSLIYYNVDDRGLLTDVAERAAAAADPADPEQAMLAAYLSGAAHVWAGRPELGSRWCGTPSTCSSPTRNCGTTRGTSPSRSSRRSG
jgi:hypothetical protein